jgi:hypothetical protein
VKRPAGVMLASEIQENAMKTGIQECTIVSVSWIDIVAISLSVKTEEKNIGSHSRHK